MPLTGNSPEFMDSFEEDVEGEESDEEEEVCHASKANDALKSCVKTKAKGESEGGKAIAGDSKANGSGGRITQRRVSFSDEIQEVKIEDAHDSESCGDNEEEEDDDDMPPPLVPLDETTRPWVPPKREPDVPRFALHNFCEDELKKEEPKKEEPKSAKSSPKKSEEGDSFRDTTKSSTKKEEDKEKDHSFWDTTKSSTKKEEDKERDHSFWDTTKSSTRKEEDKKEGRSFWDTTKTSSKNEEDEEEEKDDESPKLASRSTKAEAKAQPKDKVKPKTKAKAMPRRELGAHERNLTDPFTCAGGIIHGKNIDPKPCSITIIPARQEIILGTESRNGYQSGPTQKRFALTPRCFTLDSVPGTPRALCVRFFESEDSDDQYASLMINCEDAYGLARILFCIYVIQGTNSSVRAFMYLLNVCLRGRRNGASGVIARRCSDFFKLHQREVETLFPIAKTYITNA